MHFLKGQLKKRGISLHKKKGATHIFRQSKDFFIDSHKKKGQNVGQSG